MFSNENLFARIFDISVSKLFFNVLFFLIPHKMCWCWHRVTSFAWTKRITWKACCLRIWFLYFLNAIVIMNVERIIIIVLTLNILFFLLNSTKWSFDHANTFTVRNSFIKYLSLQTPCISSITIAEANKFIETGTDCPVNIDKIVENGSLRMCCANVAAND